MFLNPWMMLGTAMAVVPILIHLLARRRYRVIPWAAMRFLLEALKKNRQRMQLHDRILMLLRALAVASLAVALARPTVTGRAGVLTGAGSNAMVILMDVSGSMGCYDGRETRVEAARRAVKSLLAQADADTTVALLAFSHDVRMPMGEPTRNLAFLDQELDGAILQTDSATQLQRAVQRAVELLRTRSDLQAARREVYLLTDLQAYAWTESGANASLGSALEELSHEASVVLLDVGDAGTSNLAVSGFELRDSLVRVNAPLEVSVTVRNLGEAPVANLPVSFYVDAEPGGAPSSRTSVNVEAGGQAVCSFETRFATGGEHRLEAHIGADRLMGDNQCYMVVDVLGGSSVLLVDGGDPGGDDWQGRETAYLELALGTVDASNARREAMATDIIPAYRLSEQNFGDYQAVVLCNVPRVSISVAQALARQVRGGMGLLVLLGDRAEAEALNRVLGPEGVGLLPAVIGNRWGSALDGGGGEVPAFRLLARDADALMHPVMAEFRQVELNALLASVRVYGGWTLTPVEDPSVATVMTCENGVPVILERRLGAGLVMVGAFPATTAWSNLPTQYLFPVLAPRLISRLTAGLHPPYNLVAGDPILGTLSAGEQQNAVVVHPPVPEGSRQATVETDAELTGSRLPFQYAETDRAGFYEVVIDRPGAHPQSYAVNPSVTEEADLRRIEPEEIRRQYPGFEFTCVRKHENLVSRLAAERRGIEIWPWFLALVFVFLGCESYLALRWAPRE